MKKIYAILFFLFCGNAPFAQTLIVDQNIFIGGDTCFTDINCAIPTSDGGIVFGGYTECSNSGNIPEKKSYQENREVMIGKLDEHRNLQWIKLYGGRGSEEAHSISETSDGGYIILAKSTSSDGDVSAPNKGISDIWLVKVDNNGNLQWERSYGSPFQELPISIQVNEYGGFVMLGATNGSGDDIPIHHGGQFSFDWFMIKTDAQGNKIWSEVFGGTDGEGVKGSLLCIDTGYYIVSSSLSTDIDCNDVSWFGTRNTKSNFHILKIDTAGNLIFDKSYGGGGHDNCEFGIYDNRDTTIVMIGSTNSNDYMLSNRPPFYGSSWIVKTKPNGDTVWTGHTGGTLEAFGSYFDVVCKSAYNGYISARAVVGSSTPGNQNIQIFAIDSIGVIQTQKIYGGVGNQANDVVRDIFPYKNGYVVAGRANDKNQFNEGKNTGNTGQKGGGFISYLNYWPTSIVNYKKRAEILNVFPNPTKNIVHISFLKEVQNGVLTIINSDGSTVYTSVISKQIKKIMVSAENWSPGIYFVNWSDQDGNLSTKKFTLNQ